MGGREVDRVADHPGGVIAYKPDPGERKHCSALHVCIPGQPPAERPRWSPCRAGRRSRQPRLASIFVIWWTLRVWLAVGRRFVDVGVFRVCGLPGSWSAGLGLMSGAEGGEPVVAGEQDQVPGPAAGQPETTRVGSFRSIVRRRAVDGTAGVGFPGARLRAASPVLGPGEQVAGRGDEFGARSGWRRSRATAGSTVGVCTRHRMRSSLGPGAGVGLPDRRCGRAG